ncbi:MAG: adenylyltransferase/cytidyltransferase family protein, partial [Thermodesulfovibrionales bacterium]|nr:adenylyltransferase/cytidyltransferase family protein [Thermodesulfovibrionales bacterium]
MRLGIFGGTFNPIHYGHLRAAEESRFKNHLDKILFIPSGNPPIKGTELADASMRFLMTELAISSNPHFVISDIEMRQPNKSYTCLLYTS